MFDGPAIGLHSLDAQTLLAVFQTLIDNGATEIVIEHDLDVILNFDYIIVMSSVGGDTGGWIAACGTPQKIRNCAKSTYGKFIRESCRLIARRIRMSLLDLASGDSVWRGLDYYKDKRVKDWQQTGKDTYSGSVQGTKLYHIHLDLSHPRRSTCDCPFAAGRRVICKHMVALYFTVIPGAEESFMKQVAAWEKEEKVREIQHQKDLEKYVKSLSKAELQKRYLQLLIDQENRKY